MSLLSLPFVIVIEESSINKDIAAISTKSMTEPTFFLHQYGIVEGEIPSGEVTPKEDHFHLNSLVGQEPNPRVVSKHRHVIVEDSHLNLKFLLKYVPH